MQLFVCVRFRTARDSEKTVRAHASRFAFPAVVALAYFVLFLAYLFLHRESEIGHWLSMVLGPIALAAATRRLARSDSPPLLASFGLRRSQWSSGLRWAVPLGLLLCGLQFWASRDSRAMLGVLATPAAFKIVPVALALSVAFAGFTEEFFFRGFLQSRLRDALSRPWVAIVMTAILFGAYHLPYAYFNPRWPSHGDWTAAAGAAFGQGIPGGLILGTVFHRSRGNLLASVVVHALINLFPITLSLARSSGY